MQKLKKLLEQFEDWASGILVVSGLMVLFYGVILRYVLHLPTTWQDEVARILLVWGILIGAAATLRENNHIRMELFYNVLPKNIKVIVDIFANVVILSFFIFLLTSGIDLVHQKLQTGQQSLNGYPLWIIYLILPISATLLAIRTIEKFFYLFKGKQDDSTGDLHQKL
ncbi:TRAP transporter small permease [Virgibacillus sp. W0430]|uniref:TRAP transporter small permease n=1 Tax=Virgibacillus sp. W0430 TaxID=3391580 RepID=UPI003F47CE60